MLVPISGSKNTDSDINLIYKHGESVGYNCNTPIDWSIHDFTKHDMKCDNPIINRTRETVHFQIFQQNKKVGSNLVHIYKQVRKVVQNLGISHSHG